MSRRPLRGARGLAAAALSVLTAVACVDGQTPDCSDAAAGCGPDTDGAILDAANDAADAGKDAASIDAPGDAAPDSPTVDAPLDTGADARDAKAD